MELKWNCPTAPFLHTYSSAERNIDGVRHPPPIHPLVSENEVIWDAEPDEIWKLWEETNVREICWWTVTVRERENGHYHRGHQCCMSVKEATSIALHESQTYYTHIHRRKWFHVDVNPGSGLILSMQTVFSLNLLQGFFLWETTYCDVSWICGPVLVFDCVLFLFPSLFQFFLEPALCTKGQIHSRGWRDTIEL